MSAEDQAAGLRRLQQENHGTRILPVFGPRERVTAIVNLAAAASMNGLRVLILDASRGEVAPAFGLAARYELIHVIEGEKTLAEAALAAPCGARVLPAARGLQMLATFGGAGLDLFEDIVRAAAPVDLILINAEPGAATTLLQLPGRNEALLVCVPGDDAVYSALGRIKVLSSAHGFTRFRLMTLDSSALDLAETTAEIEPLARSRFGAQVFAGAAIPRDPQMRHAQRACRSIFDIDEQGPAALAYAYAASSMPNWQMAHINPLAPHRAHPAVL
jgi:flagellar biosynthesis protein FlhG